MPAPALSIVIPCYNEERRLGETLERIRAFLEDRGRRAEVLVADDGSTDRTGEVAVEHECGAMHVSVLRLEPNRGKGAATRRGFLGATGERVLLSDADLSTPIEDLERLEEAMAGGLDLAIGSRALPDSDVVVHQPWWREAMGKTFNLLVRSLSGLDVRDSQCGFKLFDRKTCRPIFERGRIEGFSFDVELLWIARKRGLRWREVPVRWYNSPDSRVNPLVHSMQMLVDLVRIRRNDRRGAYDEESP